MLVRWGEPAYRGKQVFAWIHERGVLDPEEMTDLPKRLRARLAEEGLDLPLEESRCLPAKDGTRKLLVRMHDGAEVETVLIPQLARREGAKSVSGGEGAGDGADVDGPDVDRDDWRRDRKEGLVPGDVVTQCISSQVGCAMGCVFCASGVAGLKRHMRAAEIVSQVLLGRQRLTGNERIRNVVLMGMGEPLHNYDQVARALVLLTHPSGIGLSTRRVTLSTSGLVPQIDRLAEDFGGQVQLAISLHAVDDTRRSEIMPINRKHDLTELMACLRRYPLPKRRRITIEYTLIRGVNDGLGDADRLARLLKGIPTKVNLIPMNPITGSELDAPDDDSVGRFQRRLFERGVATFVRKQRGEEIDAACGQLALHGEAPARRRDPAERSREIRKRLQIAD